MCAAAGVGGRRTHAHAPPTKEEEPSHHHHHHPRPPPLVPPSSPSQRHVPPFPSKQTLTQTITDCHCHSTQQLQQQTSTKAEFRSCTRRERTKMASNEHRYSCSLIVLIHCPISVTHCQVPQNVRELAVYALHSMKRYQCVRCCMTVVASLSLSRIVSTVKGLT